MRIIKAILLMIVAITAFAAISSAQAKAKTNKRPTPKATTAASPAPPPQAIPEPEPPKRNERPGEATPTSTPKPLPNGTAYSYTFTRPGFTYSRIVVEHDDKGKGQISFQKTSFDEPIVDPIELSSVTMINLNEAIAALSFLDSEENYQYARDYSHMGNLEFTFKKAGRARTVRYNWTDNKHARVLMDEYRRISNEYTWRFEIDLARQNQPLMTPGLMESIGNYLDRKEISDPMSLVPFLTELSNDERLPLMARNRAVKIIKAIEKESKKNNK